MSFSNLVKNLRSEQGYTLQALSGLTDIDTGTISRIENGQTDATLITAMRLCNGLKVNFDLLFSSVRNSQTTEAPNSEDKTRDSRSNLEKSYARPGVENSSSEECSVIKKDDVIVFMNLCRSNPRQGNDLLARWLAEIRRELIARFPNYQSRQPELTGEDLIKVLVLSPLYDFSINYPPTEDKKAILQISRWNGAVIINDIQKCAALIRLDTAVRSSKRRLIESILSRIENLDIQRLKLTDVIMVDDILQSEGLFLKLFWDAYFLNELDFSTTTKHLISDDVDDKSRLLVAFILICRWFQYFHGLNEKWIQRIQHDLMEFQY